MTKLVQPNVLRAYQSGEQYAINELVLYNSVPAYTNTALAQGVAGTAGNFTNVSSNTYPEVKSASFTAVTGKAYTLGSPSDTLNIQFPVGTTDGEEIIIHMNRSAQTQAVYAVYPVGQHVAYVGAGNYQLVSGFCDHILRFEFVLSTQAWELKGIVPSGSITDVIAFCSSVNILSRLRFSLPTADGVYQWYIPAKNINFGELANVATTNNNVLGGTNCRIEGGNNNNVSGTNSSTYMCQYQTVTGTDNRAISSRPTTGTGVFTHAGNGNTYYNHRHNGNTVGSAGSNCTFYDCYGIVGASGDVNVVYRSAGVSSGVTMYGFVPHTQVTGNGVSASPLRALCMLQSPPTLTGVPAVLVSLVSGAVQDKPPLFRNMGLYGSSAYHDIVLNAYDINGYANPVYMLCLRRQVTVYQLSGTPIISVTTLGTDLNPSNLTFTVSVSVVNSYRMEITVTATDPVSPAPPIPLTYVWSAVVESTYF